MTTAGSRFQLTTRAMMKVVAAAGLILGGYRLLHYVYYYELTQVQSQLDRIAGITNVQIRGWDDITYEVHAAQFEIADRPGEVVVLRTNREDRLNRSGHLYLHRLGPWEFHEVDYVPPRKGSLHEDLAFRDWIDVGSEGSYAAMLPCRIQDASDVVANYDLLVEAFSSWPDQTTWGVQKEPVDIRTAYCCTSVGFTGRLTSPPQFPKLW